MKTYNIPNIIESIKADYQAGKITLHEAARMFCKAGWDNFVDDEKTLARLTK